ncbi:MAG TPA: hypothetical protein VIM62_07185, partial [Acidobacteriaceae bacterium]
DNPENVERVASTIAEAGGRVVGKTRLQKMVYLLEAAGYLHGFSYVYKHYGPFSENLARATSMATVLGVVRETECAASWGGTYSIFTSKVAAPPVDHIKAELFRLINDANPIDLELAATAIFIAKSGDLSPRADAWEETARRKPEKANRIPNARQLLKQLSNLDLPTPYPTI